MSLCIGGDTLPDLDISSLINNFKSDPQTIQDMTNCILNNDNLIWEGAGYNPDGTPIINSNTDVLGRSKCQALVQDLLLASGNSDTNVGTAIYNITNLPLVNDIMTSAFKNVVFAGNTLNNDILPRFIDTCKGLPGGCNDALTNICANCNKTDLSSDKTLLNLCGCFITDDRGFKNKCDNTCNISSSIKADFDSQGNEQKCVQNICVIDNIAINIAKQNSQNSGNVEVNIEQVCNNCINNACHCVFDIENEDTLAQNNISLNIESGCGASTCFKNTDGVRTPFDCSEIKNIINTPQISPIVISVLVGTLILFFLLVIVYLVRKFT